MFFLLILLSLIAGLLLISKDTFFYSLAIIGVLVVLSLRKYKLEKKIIIFLILSLTITILITKNHTHDFEMRTIETTCNDFNLSGTIAYNKNKTAIFISEIDYCGLNKDQIYDTITSTLYQNENNKIKNIITNKEKNNLSLNDYLKDLTYHVDNYKSTCLDYNKNELYIKIELQKKNESTITYTIPLKINDTCN